MENAIQIVFGIAILIFSVVIHEVSHGCAALALGDETAKYAGRLTLNPFKHLDAFGSVILPFFSYIFGGFIFGWAKPVPYNPRNLRNARKDPALVALAGPLSNLLLALIFSLFIRLAFSLISASSSFLSNFTSIAGTIVLINLILAFFNLVPIPPLDGSKILFAFIPYRWRNLQIFLEQYGFYLLLIFIFFFSQGLLPLVNFFFRLLAGPSQFF